MRALLLAIALVPALALAQAQVPAPRLLPYQGRLLRADGSPEAGSHLLTFRIYDAASGGNLLWTEHQTVPLTNGFYAAFLGSVASFPDSLFDGRDRWMSIAVDDGPELSPRQQIGSVAYAITATNALVAAQATRADSAVRADTAGSADRAATAVQATRAAIATRAETADRTAEAGRALLADEAALARRVQGPVEATTVTADSVTAASVQAATVTATSSVVTQNLEVNGTAVFRGGLTGAGSFVLGGFVNSDGSVGRRVGDAFVVAKINDGSGHYRVTAAGLTASSIVLVTHGNSLSRYGFPCIARYDGSFEVLLRGSSSDRVDDAWSFVVLAY